MGDEVYLSFNGNVANVFGKEDTLVTIQIDMLLAERFGMEYVDKDGQKKRPYIIHRTSLGCFERTLAYMIEKYAGWMPLWLAPEQARIMTITDRADDAAYALKDKLFAAGIRCEVDVRNEKIGFKIREAQMQKIPYMLIVGDKEAEEGTVSVRSRKDGDKGSMGVEDFKAFIKEEIDNMVFPVL